MPTDGTPPPGRVRMVVAYDDFDAGKRAQRACQQLLQKAHLDTTSSTDLWKFDMLKIPTMRAAAAEEAAGADLLVVALQDGARLPVGVRKWIQAILLHPSRPKALLALLGPLRKETESVPPVEAELKELAAPLGIPFWCLHLETPDGAWSEPGYAPEDLESVAHIFAHGQPASFPVPPGFVPGCDGG